MGGQAEWCGKWKCIQAHVFVHPVSLYLLVGAFNPFPFKVIINMYDPIHQGEGDDRGWDGWMASLTRGMWVWVNSRSWWWTGRPGMLQFMGLQRVGYDWVSKLNWTDDPITVFLIVRGLFSVGQEKDQIYFLLELYHAQLYSKSSFLSE